MILSRRQVLELATGAVAFAAISRSARAQTYPTRPVRIIVGFPAGERQRQAVQRPVLIDGLNLATHDGNETEMKRRLEWSGHLPARREIDWRKQ